MLIPVIDIDIVYVLTPIIDIDTHDIKSIITGHYGGDGTKTKNGRIIIYGLYVR